MNQHLEDILKLIEQSQHLNVDEKKSGVQAVKEAEEELQTKNHDLQIESSLDRVRAVALSMKKPDDLLSISKVMFAELQSLGFSNLRNGLIATFDDEKAYVRDYDYSDYAGGSSTQIPYNTNPIIDKFRKEIKSASDAFVAFTISENELNKWKEYRRSNGESDDPRLENISSLYYYFYSIGIAAIGISTFSPLTEEKLIVLKRFRNVFDLAYRRYMDVALAEAQAREAQIELALERVRAKAMAMQKTDDVNAAVSIVFEELDKLNLGMSRCGIGILNKEKRTADVWTTSVSDHGRTVQVSGDESIDIHPLLQGAFGSWLRQGDFSYLLEGADMKQYYKAVSSTSIKLPDSAAKGLQQYYYVTSFQDGNLFAFRESEFPDEAKSVMKRFAGVFNLTYKRFLDLQKAEAQTRESQIQLALERVRARTMAMQKSEELSETAHVLFQQFNDLGAAPIQITIGIFNEEENVIEFRSTDPLGTGARVDYAVKGSLEEPTLLKKIHANWKEGKKSTVIALAGKELSQWVKYRISMSGVQDNKDYSDARRVVYVGFFSKGMLSVSAMDDPSRESVQLLERFAGVFDLTYTRFLDLKQAEAQAREAQIEAALERVRSRTMGMQKSEELKEVIQVVYQQFAHLNINIGHTGFVMDYKARDDYEIWIADPLGVPSKVTIPYFDSVYYNRFNEAKEKGEDFFAINLTFEEKNKFYRKLFEYVPGLPEESKEFYFSCAGLAISTVLLENVCLYIENFSGTPYSDEENATLMRFGKVFQQTYTRFLDLQKAEEQIREAKIEAALERTRTQSMIMQHSKELDDTLRVFHEQVLLLGIHSAFSFLWLPDEEKDRHIFWAAWAENLPTGHFEKNDSTVFKSKAINYPLDRNEPATAQCLVDWKGNDPIVSYHVPPSGVENYLAAWQELIAGVEQLKPEFFTGGLYYVEAFMKYGCFGVMIRNQLPEEEQKILARFAVEFERAYTRFLDLQKAEMQAREAQIETALERVRARTMGMQHSDELKDAAALLFQQVKALGVPAYSCGYNIWEKDEKEFTSWMSTQDGSIINGVPNIPLTEDANFIRYVESKQKGEPFFVLELRGERMQEHYQYLKTIPAFKAYFDYAVSVGFDLPETQIHHLANFSHGNLLFITLEPCPEFHDVFKRFGAVFEQTYTRFLDLQKAEAQAREAKIEASLERVRSRAMAMHESSHLTEAAGTLFTELNKLGINPIRSGFVLLTKESRKAKLYPATSLDKENTVSYTGEFEFIGHPVYEKQYEIWQKKENYFPVLEGEVLKSYYRILSEALSVSFDQFKETDKQFGCFLPFSEGFLFTWSVEPYSKDEINILDRFKSILDLTIRRYLDLQKAEAQAREAQIEASLERVRSSAMAMHQSGDLSVTVNIIFRELKNLGIVPVRCGVTLINSKEQSALVTLTTASHQGESYEAIGNLILKGSATKEENFRHWQLQQEFFPVLSGKELKEYYKAMEPEIVLPDFPPDAVQYGSFLYFKEGGLFTWTERKISEEELQILRKFTSVISLTYRRYLDLKEAEAQAREAQIEAGLERVRSRTLAMHSSDELAETAAVVFKQLINLGIEPNRLYIAIIKDEDGSVEFWITDEDGSKVSSGFTANLNDNPTFQKMFAGWKEQKKSITIDMQGEELQEYFRHLTSLNVPFKGGRSQTRRVQNIAYFSQGFIGIASPDSQPEETDRLLERFASVFNLTYTRFNDLQLAEAQAKKAQMEAAMERVRGRALAMQQPEELLDVAVVLRHEMGLLGVEEIETGTVFIFDDAAETAQFGFTAKDPADPEKGTVTDTVTMDLNQTWAGKEFLKFFRSVENQLSLRMEGEQRSEWIKYLYSLSAKANNFFGENIRDRTYHLFKYSNGAVAAVSNGDITEDSWDLLKRSASVFTLAYSRFKDLTKARIDLINLKEEKKRSDSLLLNILPQEIADELKQFGKSYARKHDEVTILFADIKGFSSIAETLSAQELVTQLDECFRAFDHIVDKHGLEKIKTVGDAYVCACGLPLPVADHAAKAVRAAIDMMNFIKGFSITRTIQDLPAFEFRIGINTGSVVTGVVGLKKFTYDIWGDAVNMAARMEQHGEAGKINISESTHALIKDKFTCTSRGKIAAKNKGEVEMYFVEQ